MRVLAADDDPVLLKLLEKLLGRWGYEVMATSDGDSALKIISDPATRPDIALFDWVMPGIEGLELCRRVKTKHEFGFIYVILLTGRSNESDVVEGLDSGADDFMVKPIKADELKSRVAVGARNVEYERKLSDVNRKLQEQNGALEKYARIMESLAEDRAKQLVHAERLSTIGEMSAGIAHEINNYLSPVLGYTEMLAFKFDNQSELKPADLATCKDYLDCIGKGARRIRNLVERIRKHSRRAASRPVLTSVNEIIRQSLELTGARVRSLRLELNLDKDLPKVLVDPQELEQVFVNLIKNAADAMEAKPGLLRISSVASPSGGGVILKVADSGPGIPEDKLEHVFESFFTTKGPEKGTGLGLSVSRGIIERYGGNISASNGPSGGAVFTIVLPLPGEASGPASPQEHSQPWS